MSGFGVEQPVVGVVGVASRQVPPSRNNHIDVLGAVRSSPELDTPDLGVAFLNYLPEHPALGPPQTGFTILLAAMAPHGRGSVRLASARPEHAPHIDLGLLTDARDMATLLTGIRLARRISATRAMAEWDAVEAVPGPRAETDEELSGYVRQAATVYYHPAGTCAMGTGPQAVTDLELRVHGVDGLRVVDASVMPSLPAAPPNATVLAIAERAADLIARN
jgi:choline dehydrogenase